MMTRDSKALGGGRCLAVAGVCLLLALSACGLDKVEVPDLEGPSELGLAITLQARPDILFADGHSTSAITATVRDQNGKPKPGQPLFFAIADESGTFADIGKLSSNTVVSGGDGIARVIYRAPPRTDATANQTVLVMVRPISDDANGQFFRSVRIELRSVEPRLFPEPEADEENPTCSFIVEPAIGPYKVNTSVLFQTTAHDTDPDTDAIIRYLWDFGDGSPQDDKPDVEHHYTATGTFTVTHACTDADGSQGSTTLSITVVP